MPAPDDGPQTSAAVDKVRVANQAGLAGLAAAAPFGFTGTAAAVVAGTGAALASVFATVVPARADRVRAVAERAGLLDGTTELPADPATNELIVQILECAATSRTDEHLAALSRILRETVDAEASVVVDHCSLLVDTLSKVAAPHIRLLAAVARDINRDDGQKGGLDRGLILTQQPGLEPVLDRIVEDCVALGLMFDTSHGTYNAAGWDTRRFQLTGWGRTCLDYLAQPLDG